MIANSLVVHNSAQDERTREAHLEAHRQVVPLDGKFLVGGEEIDHPGDGSPGNAINCILPNNAIVAQGILAASKAEYSGPAFELRTKLGRSLTITPNHPIFTDRGFIGAKGLHPGDNLIGGTLGKRMVGANQHIHDMPPLIEEVFSSLDVVFGPDSARRVTITDFHGDGWHMNGDVDVKVTDGQLWCTCNAPGLKPVHQNSLCFSDVLSRSLTGNSALNTFRLRAPNTAYSSMRSRRQALAFFGRGLSHAEEHGRTDIPRLNAPFDQVAAYDTPAYPYTPSDALFGFPGQVALDELIEIRQFEFSGYVYDLQTISGLYTANGVFVHNCRCTITPVLSEAKAFLRVTASHGPGAT